MRKSAKIITALSVTGLAVVAGSAFTGTGLAKTDNVAATQFIGGAVSQEVKGATLDTIAYTFENETTKTHITTVRLTFTEAVGANRTVSAALSTPGGSVNDPACDSVSLIVDEVADGKTYDCVFTATTGVTNTTVTVV